MAKEKGSMSGAATPYQDKDGVTIRIHNYVKDAAGKRYYINSLCMAVPEEEGALSISIPLAALIEKTSVTVMTAEEVLAAPAPQSSEQAKQGEPIDEVFPELKESEDEGMRKGLISHLKELREWKVGTKSPIKVKEHYDAWITYLEKQKEQKGAAQKPGKDALTPVTMQMLLTAIPDDELANELRRRGYTLCAVRPALITL